MAGISLQAGNGGLVVSTPYNREFVEDLKNAIPYTERKFDPTSKSWVVAEQHGKRLQAMIAQYFGVKPALPIVTTRQVGGPQIFEIRYIGACKDRADGSKSAFGHCNGDWSVIFPEQVLRSFFQAGDARPGEGTTLYQVLGISPKVADDEIKTAYRRMARQWHPDVCKEPDAHEMFLKIKNAYEILTTKRDRYDAGLKLTASLGRQELTQSQMFDSYRAPFRCGYVMAEGAYQIGRFLVSKILDWQDITDSHGRTLVVSWAFGADKYTEEWV